MERLQVQATLGLFFTYKYIYSALFSKMRRCFRCTPSEGDKSCRSWVRLGSQANNSYSILASSLSHMWLNHLKGKKNCCIKHKLTILITNTIKIPVNKHIYSSNIIQANKKVQFRVQRKLHKYTTAIYMYVNYVLYNLSMGKYLHNEIVNTLVK